MYEAVNIDRSKVEKVIDWSHAVSTLHDIARNATGAKTAESMGHSPQASIVFRILSHQEYFDRNLHRMQYRPGKRLGLPRGSGIVKSIIQRVID